MNRRLKKKNSFSDILKRLHTINEETINPINLIQKEDSELTEENKIINNENSKDENQLFIFEDIDSHKDKNIIDIVQNEINLKKNRKYKYFEIVKMFIKSKYEYSENDFININDIKSDFNDYISKLDESIKPKDFNMALNVEDITLLDNRFIYKRVNICKYCKSKLRIGCCEKYELNRLYPIKQKMFIINISHKQFIDSEEDEIS